MMSSATGQSRCRGIASGPRAARLVIGLAGALAAAFGPGCDGTGPRVIVSLDGLFHQAALELVELDGATVTVEGQGIAEPLVVDVDRAGSTFEISVPAGKARRFSLEAWLNDFEGAATPAYLGHEVMDLPAGGVTELVIRAFPVGVVDATVVVPDGTAPPAGFQVVLTARSPIPEVEQPLAVPVADGRAYAVVGAGAHDLAAEFQVEGVDYSLYTPRDVSVATGEVVQPTLYVTVGGEPVRYRIGVEVAGLSGLDAAGLRIGDGTEVILAEGDGLYTFAAEVEDGARYGVIIAQQPAFADGAKPWCVVRDGAGTVSGADVVAKVLCVGPVRPLFATVPAWNEYVAADADPLDPTVQPCMAEPWMPIETCLHSGERRVVDLMDMATCAAVTAMIDTRGALAWSCDDSLGHVRVISTGLLPAAGLSTLIDFVTPAWALNSVEITAAGYVRESALDTWWSNPVRSCSGMSPPGLGEVCVLGADVTDSYYLSEAWGVALVVAPGARLSAFDTAVMLSGGMQNWLEGSFESAGTSMPALSLSTGWSVLRNVEATSQGAVAVSLIGASSNVIRNLTVFDSPGGGLLLDMSSAFNRLEGVRAFGNGMAGVSVAGPSNDLIGVIAADNGGVGVHLSGTSAVNNTVARVRTFNNGGDGVRLDYGYNHRLWDVTTFNNGGAGLALNLSHRNVMLGVTAVANGTRGIELGVADANLLTAVAAMNSSAGIYLDGANNRLADLGLFATAEAFAVNQMALGNIVEGVLVDGGNANLCQPIMGSCPEITAATVAVAPAEVASQLLGPLFVDDPVNVSDAAGAQDYASITDWVQFASAYRGWGLDGGSFPDVGQRGRCTTDAGPVACRIYDWRLPTGSALESPLALDPVVEAIHAWQTDTAPMGAEDCENMAPGSVYADGQCQTTYLPRAVELLDDSGVRDGNDNLLCEAGESCLFLDNIGSYQGEGALQQHGTVILTTGAVTLFRYAGTSVSP